LKQVVTKETQKSISLRELVRIGLKRKWMIVVPVILVMAIAYGSSLLMTPRYGSSTIIWIDRPSNVSRDLERLLGGDQPTSRSSSAQNLKALENELKSQMYLYQVIQNLNLNDAPEITRKATKLQDKTPNFSLEQIKFELLVDQLRDQISLQSVGHNQIKITVESESPLLARDMVDNLAKILEEEKTRYELGKILDNQSFADEQLNKKEDDYQEAVDSLTAAQSRLVLRSLPENISSESNRRDISSDIDKARFEIADYQRDAREYENALKAAGINSPKLRRSKAGADLRANVDQQVSTVVDMMEKYPWNAQNVINVNIRINDNLRLLELEIAESIDQQFAEQSVENREMLKNLFVTREHIGVLSSKVTKFERSIARIEERINEIPRIQAEITELGNRVSDIRRYRDVFKTEETTVEIRSERLRERTVYRIIEPARIPLVPIWPNLNKILVLGLALGFVLGGAAAVAAELFDNSFKKIDDVERELDLHVLATIPRMEHLKIR
jgi:succinoglycan biosynthesis transport protein ExoP